MSLRTIKIPMLQPERSTTISLSFLNGDTAGMRPEDKPAKPQPYYHPTQIVWICLAIREFLATFSYLLLSSRLGGDIFIAAPIVTMYVNIFFRRPLINPFITTLACASSGDWKKANVSGMPNFEHAPPCTVVGFWLWLTLAQLSGAALAAVAKANHAHYLGDESIPNAAWGVKAMQLRNGTCWGNATGIPIRSTASLDSSCTNYLQGAWWFTEDFAAALFLIVAYVHIWRWLRWDDMQHANPRDNSSQYWEKITTFSAASALINLMNVMAFPTAHAGLHTSVYASVYQSLREELTIVSKDEAFIRGVGGCFGCALAVSYEFVVARIDSYTPTGRYATALRELASVVHLALYGRELCQKPTTSLPGEAASPI
jgi:hypothetical protein